jgi:hypothetical protein
MPAHISSSGSTKTPGMSSTPSTSRRSGTLQFKSASDAAATWADEGSNRGEVQSPSNAATLLVKSSSEEYTREDEGSNRSAAKSYKNDPAYTNVAPSSLGSRLRRLRHLTILTSDSSLSSSTMLSSFAQKRTAVQYTPDDDDYATATATATATKTSGVRSNHDARGFVAPEPGAAHGKVQTDILAAQNVTWKKKREKKGRLYVHVTRRDGARKWVWVTVETNESGIAWWEGAKFAGRYLEQVCM